LSLISHRPNSPDYYIAVSFSKQLENFPEFSFDRAWVSI
jgi:hypothetical protein